ncbi:Na+/H+ antiporter subunit E, partial [Candidatus Bipolaricaulota bacterium]|nr:Na+/H+ antiporter subunit E [Candidatus Bipolaricaulota bacterium]
LNWQEVLTGVVLSALVAVFGHTYFTKQGLRHFSLKKLLYFIIYIPIFFWEVLKANLDVAYRVLHPKMPIKPGIVLIRTGLKSDTGKLVLANSITLTPGTLTMDVEGEHLLIHWINVKSEDPEEATEFISKRFEPYLRGIFS